ncbi:unnamed protein product [Cyprideis torosa]|uniref:Uncharacterized protein n=1 Tax=Cyprideis torosa TaxID=163714 RepID=A0A7R8WLY3_9CRUS|nr:unnamed protein product [Cyprideis torosa]CAG0898767.1 unnamed protein product [Cyprideis torosa]
MRLPPHVVLKVALIPGLFFTFALYLRFLLSHAPSNVSEVTFPNDLDSLRRISATLIQFKDEHGTYVLLLFSSAYLFKQSFAIPGSVLMIERHRSQLLRYLIMARIFPGTPNWLLNISAPIAGIPIKLFFLSVLVGLFPYNYICVTSGDALSHLESLSDIWSWRVLGQLCFLAFLLFTPTIIRRIR